MGVILMDNLRNIEHLDIELSDNRFARTELEIQSTNYIAHGTYIGIHLTDTGDDIVDMILTEDEVNQIIDALRDSRDLVRHRKAMGVVIEPDRGVDY